MMKTTRKTALRIVAVVLAALMIGAALVSLVPLLVNAADESEGALQYPISDYTPGVTCPDPIPLLCIVVNFDANGNGVDDNADGSKASAVKTSGNALYGEQWCHFNHDVWYNMLFSDEGQTLKNYYKLMSDGKFYFTPAPETYADASKNGVANDGIVEVVINGPHLELKDSWVYYYKEALQQIDQYVDFSVFDKDGNGKIDKRELIISFINGGAELAQTPYGTTTNVEVFRARAYYRKDDGQMRYEADGFTVGYGGIFTTGSWSSMSSRADKATEFAVWAHELGHYLGAPDYYDTDKSASGDDPGYHYAAGYYSLMAKGCHGGQPSHIDPFTMTSELTGYGFVQATDVRADGEYTLYSKTSSEGKYNVIKLNTPNPGEYFLIENRYVASDYEGEAFDKYGIADKQGIVIWHVDENNYSSTAANNSNDGNDPTLAVYATNIKTMQRTSGQTILAAFGRTADVFNPTEYKFPVSKTWYTSLTSAEAKKVENLRVEVISEPGEEMTIKVTGSYKLDLLPEISMFAYDWTKNSVTIKGSLQTLNYSTLTSAKFTLTEKATGTVVKETPVQFQSDYTYEIPCEGLTAGKEYEFKIVAESSHGTLTLKDSNFTKPEEVKQVTITLVINSDHYTTTTQKVNVGKTHTIRVNATKKGYYLEGWYLDEAYTQPYTPGVIDKEGDFTIYAKWVAGSEPSQTTAPPATTVPPATTAGTTAPIVSEPSGGCGGGSAAAGKNDMLMLCGGSVAAVFYAAAGKKLGKKKSGSGHDDTEE
ncbi:MAG: InlB B-repeat-containing protein [Clostridia bacterium]|nr:InlB B-repeat-containing protein [Clostridia bacterium]